MELIQEWLILALLFISIVAGLVGSYPLAIVLHELGHWLVAKILGVWVPIVYLGRDEDGYKPLPNGQANPSQKAQVLGRLLNTQFVVRGLPLCGYVLQVDLRYSSVIANLEQLTGTKAPSSRTATALWKRLCITAGGPAANLLCGLLTVTSFPLVAEATQALAPALRTLLLGIVIGATLCNFCLVVIAMVTADGDKFARLWSLWRKQEELVR